MCGEEVPPTARPPPADRPPTAFLRAPRIAQIPRGESWGGEGGRWRAVGGRLAGCWRVAR